MEFVLFGGKVFVKTLTWYNWGDHVRTELAVWRKDSRKHNINNVLATTGCNQKSAIKRERKERDDLERTGRNERQQSPEM